MKKSEQQRQNIIDVGRKLFAEKGYAGTSTRELNEQAGIAEGLLYYYFPKGKRQLLDIIVHEGVTDRLRMAHERLEGWTSENVENHVLDLFDGISSVIQEDVGYQSFIITVRERALLSDEQSAWLMASFDGVQEQIADVFLGISKDHDPAEVRTLSQTVMSIFVKMLFEDLLLHNHREISDESRKRVAAQIHLVLRLL
ncbi:TetR/AcrR family transcriptional regulator [Levilactobacillus cerevisiae]|uniref:TetR/AcrR family transcriptional regulator n=1 Tax=Levilactobacillus cerevisiae TaxID=1704076 RepID=UPI000F7943DA|nr:TetR/AcrR family transcriptional regulator [Levilactobacillus cerevisiae]